MQRYTHQRPPCEARFDYDRVSVRVEPAPEVRFLVLNERYYPGWRATVDGRTAEIYPTNLVMRGMLVPAGATLVELRFVPFLATGAGLALLAAGLVLTAVCWWGLRLAVGAAAAPAAGTEARIAG